MDAEERLRLKILYGSYADDVIIELISQGQGAYREGVYELLTGEVKKRGLEQKMRSAQPRRGA